MPKALQVTTGDNRQLLMSRRPIAAPDRRRRGRCCRRRLRGSRGPVAGVERRGQMAAVQALTAGVQGIEVRQDFRPLVFWLGSATTGADGRATTTVTLPDSLTTYRIMAVAGDQASRFGFAEREIRATKPLTLLPAFPRFLSKGDRASFGAVLTNSGTDAGNAVVTIESLDPGTLQFGTRTTRTVRNRAGYLRVGEFRRARERRRQFPSAHQRGAGRRDRRVRDAAARHRAAAAGDDGGVRRHDGDGNRNDRAAAGRAARRGRLDGRPGVHGAGRPG